MDSSVPNSIFWPTKGPDAETVTAGGPTRWQRRELARREAAQVARGRKVYRQGRAKQQSTEFISQQMSAVLAGTVPATPAMRRNVLRRLISDIRTQVAHGARGEHMVTNEVIEARVQAKLAELGVDPADAR